jgi:hypothetical protein
MLEVTKKKLFEFQSLLQKSKNLEEIKGIPKSKTYMSGVSRNIKVKEIKKTKCKSRVLRRNYLIINLLFSFILRKEMLHKNLLLGSSVLCSSSHSKNVISPLLNYSTRSTCFLNMKETCRIQTRSMMSQRVVARAMNSLHNVPRTNLAQYATHRVCAPEPNPIDPQALKNNPYIPKKNNFIRHPEIRRQECGDDTDCKEKSCPTLCSPPKGPEKATGHLTHGTPQNPYAKTVEKLDSVDAQGNPTHQNAVFYKNAHNTGSAVTEKVQATSYINQPHIANKIIKHEDKN